MQGNGDSWALGGLQGALHSKGYGGKWGKHQGIQRGWSGNNAFKCNPHPKPRAIFQQIRATNRVTTFGRFSAWFQKSIFFNLHSYLTTSVAEGSFRTMKGLLTYDRHSMEPQTRMGYLLAMVNGEVNNHIPEGAKEFHRKCPYVQCSVRARPLVPPTSSWRNLSASKDSLAKFGTPM